MVYLSGSDGSYHFWDKDSRMRLKGFSRCNLPISAACFNKDGSIFAYSVSYDWSRVVIWSSRAPAWRFLFVTGTRTLQPSTKELYSIASDLRCRDKGKRIVKTMKNKKRKKWKIAFRSEQTFWYCKVCCDEASGSDVCEILLNLTWDKLYSFSAVSPRGFFEGLFFMLVYTVV
jgi:hypothetical protein